MASPRIQEKKIPSLWPFLACAAVRLVQALRPELDVGDESAVGKPLNVMLEAH